jgi:hypothetical protein
MKIYRVEHDDGIGPYSTRRRWANSLQEEINDELAEAHNDSDEHPLVYYDVKNAYDIVSGDSRRCGFISIEQLFRWFDGFMDKLEEAGYKIVVYEVPPQFICVGTYQCLFDVDESQCLGEQRLNDESFHSANSIGHLSEQY